MKQKEVERRLEELVETLAAIEHKRWSHWQRYMHENCERRADGSLVIPSELAQHWERQSDTQYESLTEKEKASDRDQVRRYLPLIARALAC